MIRKLVIFGFAGFGLMCVSNTPQAISQERYPEIPESISLENLKNIFQPVDFPHRKHAHMSKIGVGCVICHHYAEDDIYDPCADCHTNNSADLDSEIPSLNAAYHRKCLSCHRDWNAGNVCGTCHIEKRDSLLQTVLAKAEYSSRIRFPHVVSFQTPQADKAQVTFHHAEHVEMFRFECNTCHQEEHCKTCHGPQQVPEPIAGELSIHHFPCSKCHDTQLNTDCEKCHRSQPSSGFTHDMTDFPLKAFHINRSCTVCHDPNTAIKKLDRTCTNCHKEFELGAFDHETTGLVLELGHEEFDCFECHLEEHFDQPPSCYECHEDDMSFPDDLPGYRLD